LIAALIEVPAINAVSRGVEVFEPGNGGEKRIIAQYLRPKDLELSSENVTTGSGMTNTRIFRKRYPAPLEIETTFKTWGRVDQGGGEMAAESTEPIERWTAKRRVVLVVSILKGETSVAEAARTHGLTVAEVEEWREKFLVGTENALRSRPKDEEALKDEQIKKLKQKIGDLVLDNDILREALKPYPLDRKTSDA
jgi:transposase-like protein